MLIEELRKRVGPAPLPPFDAKEHARLYKAQPKERRRIVNALVRAGGEMEYARLVSDTCAPPEAFRGLFDLGLVTPIPYALAPVTVVLPLERLFATPLLENDPDKLVEALKIYPREGLWAIASKAGVPVDGADEFTLRARLFVHATAGRTLEGLPPAALEPLRLLRKRGWSDRAGRFFAALRLLPPAGDSAANLFAVKGPPADLLLRMLLIPVRSTTGEPYYADLAVPSELRAGVEELLAAPAEAPPEPFRPPQSSRPPATAPARRAPASKAPPPPPTPPKRDPDCTEGRTLELSSREGRFPGDLARFLLLLDQEPPSVTQKGTLNRRDLGRLAKRAGIPEEEMDLMDSAASCLQAYESDGETVRVAPGAADLVGLSAGEMARRFLKKLPPITFDSPYRWYTHNQHERINRAVRDELEGAMTDTGTTVCLHCVADSLRGNGTLLKVLRPEDHRSGKAARVVVDMLGAIFRFTGVAAGALLDGRVRALRLTPTGEAALGRGPLTVAAPRPEEPLIVQPSGEIIAPRSIPFDDLRRIARAAEVKAVDAVAIFSLNRKTLLRAAQRGEDLEALRALLASRSAAPLPQTVRFLLEEILARTGEIEILPCSAVIKLKDPALLRALGARVVPLADGLAMLAPQVDPAEFDAELRKQGYLPRMARPEKVGAGGGVRNFLQQAWLSGACVELHLRDGYFAAGFVKIVDGDTCEIEPVLGGRGRAVPIGSIASARRISP